MSRIQPTYSDRVRYTLQHTATGSLVVDEPIGWRDDDNEFVRNTVFHGILTQMTNSLKFTGTGKDFIDTVYGTYGINADLRLVKDERNPTTDIYERSYDGFLDLSTLETTQNITSVKFNSSDLFKLLKSRQSEKIELERLDTIDGSVLEPLDIKTVNLQGRQIFLRSLLEVDAKDSATSDFRMNFSDTNLRFGALNVPTTIVYKSDDLVHSTATPTMTTFGGTTPDTAEVAQLFYAINDRAKTLNLSISFSCDAIQDKIDDLDDARLYVALTTYENGTDYDLKERTLLTPNIINDTAVIIPNVAFEYEVAINLLEGESLSLQWYGRAEFGGALGSDGDLNVDFENIISTILIEEDSFFDSSQSNVLLPYEIADRLLSVITDRTDILKSDTLGRTDLGYDEDGEVSLCGATSGMWLRNFADDDELYKPFTTTWKDFTESYMATWNLGIGVEKVGFSEVARIEDLKYFYNRNTLIHIGTKDDNGVFTYSQVSNVKRTVAKEWYFSGTEFGYDRVEDYEEANGLDEYNFRNTYTTVINRIEQKYTKLSKWRADGYGIEFARRKQQTLFPTDDTKYDKSNFLLDMKRGVTDIFEQRLWADDFAQEPTGVFSPETANNLRLSPFNILLRHGWVLASGLTKYPVDFIRYGSSVANSNLKTQLIGGVEYAENGNIQNNALEEARFIPELIEFNHPVDTELLSQINGTTEILGEKITNWYGKIAFMNEKGQIERGYLQSLKPNGAGSWKLLKSN